METGIDQFFPFYRIAEIPPEDFFLTVVAPPFFFTVFHRINQIP